MSHFFTEAAPAPYRAYSILTERHDYRSYSDVSTHTIKYALRQPLRAVFY